MQDAHTLQKDDVLTTALGKSRNSAESDILIVQLLVDLKLKPKRARSASTATVSKPADAKQRGRVLPLTLGNLA